MDAGGWNEGGKNRWRYKEGSEGKIIEIELTQEKVALIDSDRLQEVLSYRWATYRAGNNDEILYALTRRGKRANGTVGNLKMHIFLFPDVPQPRDHIDHNGLNNTRANIRQGTHGINQRNTRRGKQDTGVTVQNNLKAVITTWRERNGQQKSQLFTWSKYDTPEDAYKAAVEFRQRQTARVFSEIEDAQRLDPNYVQEKYVSNPQSNKTGRKYVAVVRKGKCQSVVGERTVDGVCYRKYFNSGSFDGDIDKAMDAAHTWAKEIGDVKRKGKKRDKDN